MRKLANVYMTRGEDAQAEQLYRQLLDIERRAQGPEHPDTLAAMHTLGIFWDQRGKYVPAEALLGKIVEIRSRVSGPEHRETLTELE